MSEIAPNMFFPINFAAPMLDLCSLSGEFLLSGGVAGVRHLVFDMSKVQPSRRSLVWRFPVAQGPCVTFKAPNPLVESIVFKNWDSSVWIDFASENDTEMQELNVPCLCRECLSNLQKIDFENLQGPLSQAQLLTMFCDQPLFERLVLDYI